MSRKRFLSITALLMALALVGTACGGDGDEDGDQGQAKQGGELIVGAEQFPDCLNVIDTCSSSSWLHWTVPEQVLPKAMTLDPDGNYIPSAVLVEEPTADNGGIKTNPFTITFKIKEEAVWDDASPITAEDFEFTWKAVLETTGTYGTLGYDKIKSIDTTNPKVAVIEFTEPVAYWRDIYGGSSTNGYILKKAAFKDTDLKGEMQDNIKFSGGPWKLTAYTKDESLTLERNDAYWGKKANLDRVQIVAREDQSTEIASLLSGEVHMIYPQPSAPGDTKRLQTGAAGVKVTTGGGTTYEGLWINMDAKPMDDKLVRQAFAYAADRTSVLDTVIKPDNPQAIVLNCAGWVPGVGDWCDNTDYEKYKFDPTQAKSLLQQAGWNCPATGTCTKGGDDLEIEIVTTAGNKGRALAFQILQEKAKAAGFDLKLKTLASPSPIFTDYLPKRNHTVAIFANVASPDPTVTSFLHSGQIPKKDGTGGANWSGWKNDQADAALSASDQELDVAKRVELIRTVGDLEAEELPWIPMYQKPLITAWRDDVIGGPIDAYNSSPLSALYNMNEWFKK